MFDLIFAFFYMQVITIVFCIVLDFISTFFCMQVIHMLFWGELQGDPKKCIIRILSSNLF